MTRILAAVLALALAAPALADEPPCVRVQGKVVCTSAGFATLVQVATQAQHDRDVARADAQLAQQERAACEQRAAQLEHLPAPAPRTPWPWLAAGGAAGVIVGVVVTTLVARAVR